MTDGHSENKPKRVLMLIAFGLLSTFAYFWSRADDAGSEPGRALERRGHLLVAGASAWLPQREGTDYRALGSAPQLEALLRGQDGPAFAASLKAAGFDGVLLDPSERSEFKPGSVAEQLLSMSPVDGLLGVYFSDELFLFGVDRLSDMPQAYSEVLATAARRMLAGESPPKVQSFPEMLRSVQHVEVMVLLRAGPRPRLWRSARGSSIARAFLTAVRVAGRRWREREQAMGEPLIDALPHLTVEVSLLRDDGEIGTRTPAFVDRVVTPDHGVAYELKGAWRYLLPAATREQGQGSASRALSQLLEDSGLPADAYSEPFIRLSRLRVRSLGVSPPTMASAQDPLAAPADPDRVLNP